MKLTVNRQDFINKLVTPVSKISENLYIDFCQSTECFKLKTKASTPDGSFNLFAEIDCQVDEPKACIIPDCKTFLRLFANIEDELLTLTVDSNSISYKQNNLSFKYHLLDDSYFINKKTLSEEKINALTYDTLFNITKQKLSEISKFHSIIPDAEKLYFLTKGNHILAKLGDELKANTNEITLEIASSFQGDTLISALPLNIQNVLLFSFPSESISVSINQALKVFKFEAPDLKYIVSGLVK